jgi:cytosine/adenosine deaminase-related metal-dependent hydrolase
VALVNARVVTPAGLAETIRFGSTVLDLDAPPRGGDAVVDLAGAYVLPGLVNAHDHLELNHYGPLKPRASYAHADDWIDDLRPRLRDDAGIREKSRYRLGDRLLAGAVKNLLAGVTTVAHHNPVYREIGRRFPLRVLARFRWAHSFSMEHSPVGANGEPGGSVSLRCAATPAGWPFVVHLGEGVDERARCELERFADLGCFRANTVVVHGVAHTRETWRRAIDAGTSLVWCPASNEFLFGRTVALDALFEAAPASADSVCLGSDSRLTGERDLLDEIRRARACVPLADGLLLRMVTTGAARILRLPDAGRLAPGGPADLIVVPAPTGPASDPEAALLAARRRDLRLVVVGGSPRVAATEMQPVFEARRVTTGRVVVDGIERLADDDLRRRLAASPIEEPGLELGT